MTVSPDHRRQLRCRQALGIVEPLPHYAQDEVPRVNLNSSSKVASVEEARQRRYVGMNAGMFNTAATAILSAHYLCCYFKQHYYCFFKRHHSRYFKRYYFCYLKRCFFCYFKRHQECCCYSSVFTSFPTTNGGKMGWRQLQKRNQQGAS